MRQARKNFNRGVPLDGKRRFNFLCSAVQQELRRARADDLVLDPDAEQLGGVTRFFQHGPRVYCERIGPAAAASAWSGAQLAGGLPA